eukprot:TRINITY_DN409_c0_g3_i5.p1 TRINITY_DN409_c0_g3~~TRINITY_DN409_c0_g3_i5.p1  ORF type:complete len:188 (-),score=38.90 TRINITY_DN409_c0_g3_i5:94-585(-)
MEEAKTRQRLRNKQQKVLQASKRRKKTKEPISSRDIYSSDEEDLSPQEEDSAFITNEEPVEYEPYHKKRTDKEEKALSDKLKAAKNSKPTVRRTRQSAVDEEEDQEEEPDEDEEEEEVAHPEEDPEDDPPSRRRPSPPPDQETPKPKEKSKVRGTVVLSDEED